MMEGGEAELMGGDNHLVSVSCGNSFNIDIPFYFMISSSRIRAKGEGVGSQGGLEDLESSRADPRV